MRKIREERRVKHQELIEKMTLEEKAAFLSGKNVWQTRDIERLGIPSIFCSDGPHGIRKQAGAGDHLGLNASLPATCFPTAATVANSWNEELGMEIGKALGEEAAAQEVHVLLGPGLNMKRSPLCGRNFEYFSEDPYLAGKMAASYIKGIQSQGVYANENKHLLQEILRGEWGFDGIVITDCGASNDHAKGVAAGSNLEMPSPGLDSAREILKALENKKLTVEELDACVDDLLDAVLTLSKNAEGKKSGFEETTHHNLARKAAAESAVLLKNVDDLLPLASGTKVAIIGDFAVEPRYQGAGSSVVNPTYLETLAKTSEKYDLQIIGINRGYQRNGEEDAAMRKEALTLTAAADVVLYCFGLDEISESEGMDRSHMRIPQNQIELLSAIAQVNANVVGVLSAGSAIEMPWHYCCKAILYGYLNGQAGASAMMGILTGKINPSGRLSETYPIKYEDTPAYRNFPSPQRNAEYRESLYIGYRYYDTSRVRVQYPFGYGLSYTTFEYSDLKVDEWEAEFTLTNTGDREGAEVAQLYVGMKDGKVFRPAKELKGFTKVFLKAGESKKVKIRFDDKTFRYWNVKTNQWEVEGGVYQIMIGASVSDIRLQEEIQIHGTQAECPYMKEKMPSYYSGLIQQVSDEEFEQLLGYPIPYGKWAGELGINDAICQMYYAKSGLARFIYNVLTNMKKKVKRKVNRI